MTSTELQTYIQKSAFNRQKYTVNVPVGRFIRSLMSYVTENIENPTYNDILDNGVPNFQRSNDQWTEEMQIKFVENVVKGLVPTIQLYEIKGEELKLGCKILDGLQRVTALSFFIEGKIKLFNNTISYIDIKDNILKGLSKTVIIEVFNFDNDNDAIDFYVEMNENITHSPEDIKKALSFKTN